MPDDAADRYGEALALDPGNEHIAWHAYRRALLAGDEALALRAARTLDDAGTLPGDGQVLLFIAAARVGDLSSARARLEKLARVPGLDVLAPLFGEWLTLRTPAPPDGGPRITRANAYAGESRALLAIARGDVAQGSAAIRALWPTDPYRSASLRIAAAATLAAERRGGEGARLLGEGDGASERMRVLALQGDAAGLAIDTPLKGVAFLLARVSGDLTVEGSGRLALTMARLASFADPGNARLRLNVAGALAAARRNDAALESASALVRHPVYGDDAASFRIEQLEALGRFDEAATEAHARAERSSNDRARVGDIEMKRGRYGAAADAYLAVLRGTGEPAPPALLRAAAHALERAGRWPEARPIYERLLTASPADTGARVALAAGVAEHDGAVERARRLVDLPGLADSADAQTLGRLGRIRFRSGEHAQAAALLEIAARGALDDAALGDWLGDAYWALGRRVEARYAWRAAGVHAEGPLRASLAQKIDRGLP